MAAMAAAVAPVARDLSGPAAQAEVKQAMGEVWNENFATREDVMAAMEQQFPSLRDVGSGGGLAGWDVDYQVDGKDADDQRTLNLKGDETGTIRTKIIKNYGSRDTLSGAPFDTLEFGASVMKVGGELPAEVVRAATMMMQPPEAMVSR